MAPTQHFKTVFWSQKQPEQTLPDFQTGFSVLHQKLGQSRVENEEMISFFKDRIAIEEIYANKLTDQGKINYKSAGFGRDEGAGLFKCFSQLKETSRRLGEQRRTAASTVTSEVLVPLQDFHEEYKRVISNSKLAIDSMLKQFDGLVKDTEKSRSIYHRKCKEADKAEDPSLKITAPKAVTEEYKKAEEKPSSPLPDANGSVTTGLPNIQLGNQVMPQPEFDSLIRRMRQEITLRDYKVPILGTYKNTSTGEDIAIWLQQNLAQCKDSPAMADVVGQQLIQPYNILRLVGQRGSKFTAAPSSFYQWRSQAEGGVRGDEDTTHPNLDNSNGLMDDPSKKIRREVDKSEQSYRAAVLKLDQMRMGIEEAMFTHLKEMEQVELHRIQKMKKIISSFIATLSIVIPQDKLIIEEMMVFHESLKPDQDIQYIIQQYAVAGFSPKAILYESYYHGIAHDQVFGVPLEELGKQIPDNIPIFLSTLLLAIDKGIEDIQDQEKKQQVWSTPCALDRVHAACLELNVPSDTIHLELFNKYEPDLLIAVLRYYLMELPDCLLTFEFYDPVDALLGGNYTEQDEDLRLASFSNLIATLPATHFASLQHLLSYITRFIQKESIPSDIVDQICQTLGPVILRSRMDTFSILNSRVPFRLVHELIHHYQHIFSKSTLKLHEDSEKRRHAKPIVAQEKTSSSLKRGNSLMMSFMRPATTEGWSNMMGVFQRNTPTNPIETPPSSRSVPLSFASTITQHESPPSSPIQPAEVMFDGGDDIFDERDDILQDMDTQKPTQQRVDSSFFDDDEEEEEVKEMN